MTRGLCVKATILFAAVLVFALAGSSPASAEHTRFWRQSDYENFARGTAKGTALRSDGRIMLAPRFAPLADAGLAYLWALQLDSRGHLYAAGGSNAKVVRVDAAGRTTAVFDSSELSAQALTFDRRDNLYVATSPDGKIYKVTPDGQKSLFFDPKMKYIWDLAMGADGTLYVATGDTGTIFSVSPDGKGDVFYASSETHVRSLALDGKGNLLAGTEPNGLVLRIPLASPPPAAAGRGASPQGAADAKLNTRQAYVLYETTRREITSLAIDPSGNLYVGAIGEKPRAPQPIPQAQPQPQQQVPTAGAAGQAPPGGAGVAPTPAQQALLPAAVFQRFPTVTSSAVYRIAADGSPEELWASRDDIVYSLGVSPDGKLLLGTGNQGVVIELSSNRIFSRLARSGSGQITGLARAANGTVFVATANPGKIFTLGPGPETEGTFESQPFDARIFSRWGRLTWWGENGVAGMELYVRAGNTSDPENSWSPWFGPYRNAGGEEVQAPAARFVQWKAVLQSGPSPAPEISWVSLAYLPKNVAPRIDAIVLQEPGIRVASPGGQGQATGTAAAPVQLRLPPTATQGAAAARPQADTATFARRFQPPPQGFAQKGHQAVLWTDDDDNEDELTYSIYYRGENERGWKLLRDEITQRFYSWDTTSMPDGAYYLKIAAFDKPANAPGEALSTERESDRFVVDNTPPEILGLAAEPVNAAGASGVTVRFRASDATSAIVNAQYSLDAGDWIVTLPAGGVSDSLEEPYAITLRNLTPGEHTLAVRAYDQYDNLGTAKVIFTIPAPRR